MRGPGPTSSLRRLLPPLIAVLGCLGPATALAASPAPSAPAPDRASGGRLAPDPAPAAVHTAARVQVQRHVAVKSAPVVNAQPTLVTPRVTVTPVTEMSAPSRATPKRPRPAHVVPRTRPVSRTHPAPVRIVDVMPLSVDLHPHLGAVASPLLDHSALVLAAIALLAAVATAGSGAALVLTAKELL
jgi:hypothetical protein